MSRANNGGWDFVKVGGIYQMKEDWAIYEAEVLEDLSTAERYGFKVRMLKSNVDMKDSNPEFTIDHIKEPGGYWSGMVQIYETPEYMTDYIWENTQTTK